MRRHCLSRSFIFERTSEVTDAAVAMFYHLMRLWVNPEPRLLRRRRCTEPPTAANLLSLLTAKLIAVRFTFRMAAVLAFLMRLLGTPRTLLTLFFTVCLTLPKVFLMPPPVLLLLLVRFVTPVPIIRLLLLLPTEPPYK